MKALILCAGKGCRLQPLTHHCPKPLLPVLNRPCVEYLVEGIVRAGITQIAINRHHLAEQFPARLGSGSRWGAQFTYTYEPELLAAMGTVKSLSPFWGEETALVVNGDIILDLDLQEVIHFHRRHGGVATMVFKPLQSEFIHPVGFDSRGRMRQCRGQPAWGGETLQQGINVGVNLFEPRVWKEYIPPDRPYELGPQLYPDLISRRERVYGFPLAGYWADIGTPQGYLAAHREILTRRPPGYSPGREREPGVWWEEDLEVGLGARFIPPVYLGPQVRIGSRARVGPYAVLGSRSRVGERSQVFHSVLQEGVQVPPGVVVGGEIWGPGGRWAGG